MSKFLTLRELLTIWYDGEEEIPEQLGVKELQEFGIPLVLSCKCCGMTMVPYSARFDSRGNCFCSSCAVNDDDKEEPDTPMTVVVVRSYDYSELVGVAKDFTMAKELLVQKGIVHENSQTTLYDPVTKTTSQKTLKEAYGDQWYENFMNYGYDELMWMDIELREMNVFQ